MKTNSAVGTFHDLPHWWQECKKFDPDIRNTMDPIQEKRTQGPDTDVKLGNNINLRMKYRKWEVAKVITYDVNSIQTLTIK